MLVNMKEMLKDAELHNYAIGSLNTPNLEILQLLMRLRNWNMLDLLSTMHRVMTVSVIRNMVL